MIPLYNFFPLKKQLVHTKDIRDLLFLKTKRNTVDKEESTNVS
jgi:hypothetical protein